MSENSEKVSKAIICSDINQKKKGVNPHIFEADSDWLAFSLHKMTQVMIQLSRWLSVNTSWQKSKDIVYGISRRCWFYFIHNQQNRFVVIICHCLPKQLICVFWSSATRSLLKGDRMQTTVFSVKVLHSTTHPNRLSMRFCGATTTLHYIHFYFWEGTVIIGTTARSHLSGKCTSTIANDAFVFLGKHSLLLVSAYVVPS